MTAPTIITKAKTTTSTPNLATAFAASIGVGDGVGIGEMLTTTLELAAGGGAGTVVPNSVGAIAGLLTTSLFGGKIVGVGIASVGFPVSSSSGTSGTSGERVKSGVPRLRWIVFVLGGRVVVVVPESVSVSLLVGRTGGMGTG